MKPPAASQPVLPEDRWHRYALCYVSAVAWAATAVLLGRGIASPSVAEEAMSALLAATAFMALLRLRPYWTPAARRMAEWASARSGLASTLILGVLLRLAWAHVFPSQPSSDGRSYLELARKLAAGEAFETAQTLAYWPPGYAYFLSAFLRVFGAEYAVLFSQLALFLAAAAGVHRLTRMLANRVAANTVALLFALWPNLLAHSDTADKETLVIALLVWAATCVQAGPGPALFCGGLLLGAATLVQPSVQLLIPLLALLLFRRADRQMRGAVALLVLGAGIALAPWAWRNYQVFGTFKLVSTNGGSNLYRANNPLANGGYTPRGEVDLSRLGEIEQDDTGKRLAAAWIQRHPLAFLRLGIEKQLRFMGDDAGGVASTFRWQGIRRNNSIYFCLKMLANLWWLLVWLLVAALLLDGARLRQSGVLIWGWMYFLALHSVFESAGKYHEPLLWIPCVWLGVLLAQRMAPRREGIAPESRAVRVPV